MEGPVVDEFTAAGDWLARVAATVPDTAWDMPGLGVWTVRSLLGHATRALVTVEEYLPRSAPRIDVASAVGYLVAVARVDPGPVAGRGVTAGVGLGTDPAAAVADLVGRVGRLVAAAAADDRLATAAGGMTLGEYLPTRTVELVVHGCDLARAVGLHPDPPAAATASVCRLLCEALVATGRGPALALALAGRPVEPVSLFGGPTD